MISNMGNFYNSRIVKGKSCFKDTATACAFLGRRSYALFGLTLCVTLVIWIGNMQTVLAKDRVVAVGDNGIQVTQADMRKLEDYFAKGGFTSTQKEHRDRAVELRLFFEEAKALGLDIKTEKTTAEELSVPELLRVMSIYLTEYAKDYPIDPLAIVSYYRANPDQFTGPLDDEVKHTIRNRILRVIREKVKQEAAERLKEKYHVRLVNVEGGAE